MKILVIGDFCKDIFIYGDIKRLSPEAPVPVFNPTHQTTNNGMAGNVVENLKTLSKDIEIDFIHQEEEIKKIRYVDSKSNHMIIRVDEGEENVKRIEYSYIEDRILNSDIIIVSDYDKGFLTEEDIKWIGLVNKTKFIDTKKKLPEEIILSYDFIKLNENEFQYNNISNDDVLNRVIVTLGNRGAQYRGEVYPSPSPRETIDVSGAGDTFLSAFVIKYMETNDIKKSIEFANEMSSIVVSKRGVVTP